MNAICLKKVFAGLAIVLVGFTQWPAFAVPNFNQVTANIYRGGRPLGDDLSQLKSKYGIKTDINLEDFEDIIQNEQALANRIGLSFLSYPMNAGITPTDQLVNQVLNALRDSSKFPIYVHCKHGQDRTGLIIGLYRVFVQHYSPQDAYREMLAIGFHPKYTALDHYFRRATGYTGH